MVSAKTAMKWYHFTGLPEFKEIIGDQSLRSFYQMLREESSDRVHAEKVIRSLRDSDSESEYHRNNNIFYTPDNGTPRGIRGNDVVLGVDVNKKANYVGILAIPKVSLDHLVDIGVKKIYMPQVREVLRTAHDGKYADTPLYEIPTTFRQ